MVKKIPVKVTENSCGIRTLKYMLMDTINRNIKITMAKCSFYRYHLENNNIIIMVISPLNLRIYWYDISIEQLIFCY